MAWGMFKKVVIADRMALFVNPVYNSPQDYAGPALALATLAFAIQIYCDFSGYSDIALGSVQVMVIRLMKNFRRPYFARSISEFWQRWHISLSTWFRDYLYIPLGGNRHGAWRTALNLFITFLISGLWHGANWIFIIWGGLHGLFVAIENLLGKMLPEKFRSAVFVSKFIKPVITMLAVCIAWVFFRANSLSDAFYIESHFLTGWNDLITKAINLISTSHEQGFWGFNKAIFASLALVTPVEPYEIVLTLAALGILWYVEKRQEAEDFLFVFNQYPSVVLMVCYALLATTILALGTSYTGIPQAFIYFQF